MNTKTKGIKKGGNGGAATGGASPGVWVSSGNVFADLRLSNPDERLAKAELANRLGAMIADLGLTQAQAAARLGVDQPKVSALIRGRLDGFSTDRLLRLINAMGRDVVISIRPARVAGHAEVRVVAEG